jgi:hypothetical protein
VYSLPIKGASNRKFHPSQRIIRTECAVGQMSS